MDEKERREELEELLSHPREGEVSRVAVLY